MSNVSSHFMGDIFSGVSSLEIDVRLIVSSRNSFLYCVLQLVGEPELALTEWVEKDLASGCSLAGQPDLLGLSYPLSIIERRLSVRKRKKKQYGRLAPPLSLPSLSLPTIPPLSLSLSLHIYIYIYIYTCVCVFFLN